MLDYICFKTTMQYADFCSRYRYAVDRTFYHKFCYKDKHGNAIYHAGIEESCMRRI